MFIETVDTTDSAALATIEKSLPMDPTVHRTITALEDEIVRRFEVIKCPVKHLFANGTYYREMTIPAGTLLTSMIHKEQHLVVVLSGAIEVWDEENGSRTIEGPTTFVSPSGVRRVGFAYTDTVWATVHPNVTNEVDIPTLEERLYWTRDQLGFSSAELGLIDDNLLRRLLPENLDARAEVA